MYISQNQTLVPIMVNPGRIGISYHMVGNPNPTIWIHVCACMCRSCTTWHVRGCVCKSWFRIRIHEYVYIYMHIYIYIYIHIIAFVLGNLATRPDICIHTCMSQLYMHKWISIQHTYLPDQTQLVCTFTHTCLSYTYTHTHTHTHIYIYVYIYNTHRYTYTHT